MEETDLHKPLLPEPQEDVFVDEASPEEEDKQCGAPSRKVRFGLVAFFSIATAVVVFHLFYTSPECRSKMELMATVVMPGVEVSNLHRTAPQYRALEWLACKDPRHMTIDDDATELLERFSLVTFYYSFGGDSWWRKSKYRHDWSRWLTISSHCDWESSWRVTILDFFMSNKHGTLCDADGRVTALKIDHSNMHGGTLPTEIGNLKGLRDLNLGLNELVGPIPSEIGNLQQLTYLHLGVNKLSGPIPSEIGHLQQLDELDLSFNKFSGPIPSEVGHLQQLKHLDLSFNTLSGPIPSEVGHLQQLKHLDLSINTLSGPIPSEVGHLQQLEILEIFNNKFSGPIPSEIGHLQQLMALSFIDNAFSGPIPSEIGHLQQLKSLNLASNKFSGPIPSEIGNLQQLESLNLASNKFSGPIPSEIGHLQQLKSLYLVGNIGLTGTVPVEVGQLESIMQAVFSNTSLTGGLDDLAICKHRESVWWLQADCGGLNPKITCECCTQCCRTDENGNTHTRCDAD
eukprot:scaffold394_cov144-Cylindrotheca_fusiformis.AAC.2